LIVTGFKTEYFDPVWDKILSSRYRPIKPVRQRKGTIGQNIKLKIQTRMTTINQLDPLQEYILKSLLNCETKYDNNVSVIYGPPGTGKSYLIVSLLFELAIRKKKILFVSQNREALDVIDRMISRIEDKLIEQDDKNYISLRDFCLMIYKKRGTPNNHTSPKIFPDFDPNSTEADNDIPYNLSYVNLDKKLNYDISQDQEIGFDELLMHHLKYVKNTDPFPVPIKSLDRIDIRKIFNEFNDFNDEYNQNQFSKNNNPSNSLRFISKTNFKITLNEIKSKILEIDMFFKIDFSKMLHNILQSISIIDLLDIYKKLPDITSILNITVLQQDKVNIDELFKECQKAINLNEKLINVGDIQGICCVDNEILSDIDSKYLADREEIENCRNDIVRAKKRAEKIINFSQELASFNLKDAMFISLKTASKYFKTFDKYPYLKDIDTKKLKELINTTCCEFKESVQSLYRLFNQTIFEDKIENSLHNLFHSLLLPNRKTIFYKYQRVVSLISLEIELTEKEMKLKTIRSAFKILLGTHYTLNDCYKFLKEATFNKAAYNPINNIDENEVNKILNKILIVYEIAVKHNLEYKCIKDILSTSNRILEDFEIYNKILKKNLNLAGHNEELISQINANIKNRKINEKLFPIIKKYAKYLYSNGENTDFVNKAKNMKFKEEIKVILSKVSIADSKNSANIDLKKIDELSNLLKNLHDSDILSEYFYSINVNENILDWHKRIKNIIYLNISEFNCFINQNEFITRLKKLLGNNAQLIIDDFLKNDRVTYEDFARKVINDLVQAKLSTFSYKCKNISDNYLKEYKKNLQNTRKNYLLKGLEGLKKLYNTEQVDWRKNTNFISSTFPIIIATPKEVARYISDEKELLDYVIFDEASQLLPGQALTSIYRGKKTIIIGDPNQMPPNKLLFDNNNIDEINDDGTEESILDLAIAHSTDATYHLKVHYRSESNILFEPSRKVIYKDDGIEKIFEAGGEDKITPISIEDNLGIDDEKNFNNMVKYIKEKQKLNPDSYFVLLFTRGEIKDNFNEYALSNGLSDIINNDKFLISTVTNCQGIEGDYSIIYLNHYESISSMWFFKSNTGAYKRLNVAITRAKKLLKIFMADPKENWLRTCERIKSNPHADPKQLKSAELIESLIENGTKQINEAYMDSLLKNNVNEIDSPLTQQLYNKLIDYYRPREKELKIYCEVGWHLLIPDYSGIRQNKKNIGFRLDIGIYSLKKNRFILGIEMDGATYHRGFNKAFSDAQRQEILEIKGWQIYRIWSTNWLNDTNEEFKKLTSKIDTLI